MWALSSMLGMQGAGLGLQGLGMLKGQPMQIPPSQSPNLGETLMSQRPPMTADQAYPKQQPPQAQEQNGSLLGNSLYNNPLLRRRMMNGF